MGDREIRFGVLGLGMGYHHCYALGQAEGARLVAACDVDEERCEPVQKEFGCRIYNDYVEMLEDPDIDVVSVVTPSGMHAKHALMAAEAGKHILLEKPIEITPEKIQGLRDGVRKAGVQCGCIFQSRANPLYIKMREAIQAGRLGRLAGIYAILPWYRADEYFEGQHGTWRATWAMDGGGSLMNQGIHSLDLMIFFGGRIQSVHARYGVFAHDIEAEDHLLATVQFEAGPIGTLATTTCCYPGVPGQYMVFGDRGHLHAEERGLIGWRIAGDDEKDEAQRMLDEYGVCDENDLAVTADPMAVQNAGHVRIIADLAAAIRENRDPMITLEMARHAPEVACAMYESGRTGEEVRL